MAAMMPVSQQLRQELTSPEYESAHDAFTTGNGLLVLVLCVLVVSIVFYVFVMSEYEVTDASTFAGLANLLVSKVGVGLSCTLLCVVLLFAWRWSQGGGMGRVMSLSGGAVLLVALVVAGMGMNSSGGATGMRWSTYEFATDVREAFSAPREHPWLLLSFLILAAVSVASVRGGLRMDCLYPLSMSFVTLLLTAGVGGYTMASALMSARAEDGAALRGGDA